MPPGTPAAAQTSRPDRRHGVFETLLVVAGLPIELDAHLDRLAASLRELYDADPPPDLRAVVLGEASAGALGRLRVTVAPTEAGFECYAVGVGVDPAIVFPAWEEGVELRTMAVDGGLGAHKWVDRALLDRAEALAGPRSLPLLVDDGAVLETSRANVFVVRAGALLTPPLDGRVLPGITRARVLEAARAEGIEVREEPLPAATLLAAEEAFLTGSVRGVEPVRAVDETPLEAGKITRSLAAALRRRWLDR